MFPPIHFLSSSSFATFLVVACRASVKTDPAISIRAAPAQFRRRLVHDVDISDALAAMPCRRRQEWERL
jgi:hypothetical protein